MLFHEIIQKMAGACIRDIRPLKWGQNEYEMRDHNESINKGKIRSGDRRGPCDAL